MRRESRKTIALLVLLFFVPLVVWGQKNIPLVLENESIRQSGPRSPWSNPTATLDGTTLTFTFASATTSEVIIINQSSAQTVYSHSFESSAQLSIDLSEVCSAGINYLIRLNVFGAWWNGEFTVEETLPAPAANGTIVEQDSVFYQLQGKNAIIVPAYIAKRNILDYPDTLVIPSQISYGGVWYDVTGIDPEAFRGWTSTSIILPNTIEYIDYLAFCLCENLEHFVLPESLVGIGNIGLGQFTLGISVFAGCYSLRSVEIPEGIRAIPPSFFEECTSLDSIVLPSSITHIGKTAFSQCTSLTSIVIPEGVTILESGAFSVCTSLKTIELPKSITLIESGCFTGCSALETIVVPEGVEVIYSGLFRNCTSLSSVVLPESITSIKTYAFQNIPDSAHIYCEAKEPPALDKDAFNNYNCTIHVPYGCKETYQQAAIWSKFANIVEMDHVTDNGSSSDETGVSSIELSEEAARYYDLQGRPVDRTQKGIFILSGKKVMVK